MSKSETHDGALLAGADLYEVLEISPRASQTVIQAAYRALARHYHPDVNSDSDADVRIRRLNAAYEILRDPENRAKYDFEVARQQHWARSITQPAANLTSPPRLSRSMHTSGGRSTATQNSRAAAPTGRAVASRFTQFALGAMFVVAAALVLFLVLWTTLDLGADARESYVHSQYTQP